MAELEAMEPARKRSRPAPQQSGRGLGELPLELLHRLLALCSITDILSVAQVKNTSATYHLHKFSVHPTPACCFVSILY